MNMIPINADNNLTMSSFEIADLLGARHDSVKRTVERLILSKIIGQPPLVDDLFVDAQGKERTMQVYRLNKRDSLVVVARISPEFTARIVDRWQELEEKAAKPLDFSDPQVVIGVMNALQDKVNEQRGTIEHQGQKLKKLDRIEGASGLLSFREAAYTLNMRQIEFTQFLVSQRWIYKIPGNKTWMAYATIRQKLYLEHVDHMYTDSEGQDRVATRAKVTPKGLVKISEMLEQQSTLLQNS